MRFKAKTRYPPSSIQKQKQIVYKDSFDQPLRIRPPKRVPPFQSIDEEDQSWDDEYGRSDWDEKLDDNHLREERVYLDYRDEGFYRRSRSESSGKNNRMHRNQRLARQGTTLNWGRDHSHENRRQRTRAEQPNYKAGFDYHDVVDSVDTWEAERRHRDRRAGHIHTVEERPTKSTASNLRQLPYYDDNHGQYSINSRPASKPFSYSRKSCQVGYNLQSDEIRRRKHHHREDPFEYRRGRSEERPGRYNEYYEESREDYNIKEQPRREPTSRQWRPSRDSSHNNSLSKESDNYEHPAMHLAQTMSTFTDDMGGNSQRLDAEKVTAFFRRKDGVVISIGSTINSGKDSFNNTYDRNDPPRRDWNSPEQAAQEALQYLRHFGHQLDEENGILGNTSDTGSSSHHAEHHASLTKDDPPSHPLSLTQPVIPSAKFDSQIAAESRTSSSIHRAKVRPASKLQRKSLLSFAPDPRASRLSDSRQSKVDQPRKPDPHGGTTNNSLPTKKSDASTLLADGSTITSMTTVEKQAKIIFVEDDENDDNVKYEGQPPEEIEKVPFEQVETSQDGHLVPEIVQKTTGELTAAMSELSIYGIDSSLQPRMHQPQPQYQPQHYGTLSTNNTSLCDRLLMTCRIAAFPTLQK